MSDPEQNGLSEAMSLNAERTTALPAQCPYHRFAQQQAPAGDDLSQFALALEKLYDGLLHFDARTSRYGTSENGNTIARKYIGNLQQHASLHRQDKRFPEGVMPVASSKHTELGAMIGDIHACYRQGAKAIGDLLDETRFDEPMTQEAVKAYFRARNAYRSAVAETKHHSKNGLPHHNLIAPGDKKKLLQDYNAALEALQGSELATAASIPVHTASGRVSNDVIGGQKLGMYLFTLREAAGAQGDANLVPETARQWMASIGIQADIPKLWEGISQPDFKAQVDAICAETYRLVKERVGASAHAMQTAYLLLSVKGDVAAQEGTGELCRRTGIDAYPGRLQNDREAASLLDGLQLHFQADRAISGSRRFSALAWKLEEKKPLSAEERQAILELTRWPIGNEVPNAVALATAGNLLTAYMEIYRAPEQTHSLAMDRNSSSATQSHF